MKTVTFGSNGPRAALAAAALWAAAGAAFGGAPSVSMASRRFLAVGSTTRMPSPPTASGRAGRTQTTSPASGTG